MDIRIDKKQLIKGLSLASGIADKKSTLPILANVLLSAVGTEQVICAATDLNITVVVSLPAKVDGEGGLTVSARNLHEIVKGLGGEEVRLHRTDQNWIEIRGGRAEFKMVGMSDREYPKLPTVVEESLFPADASVLLDMIAKSAFSVSVDETRQHLAGVLFESDGTKARMVSTDGHRLSKIGREMPGGPVLEKGVLIPRKGVAEIRRVVEGLQGNVQIGVYANHFVLRAGEVVLVVKLIDGMFPPYDQVIPKDNKKRVTVGRVDLLEAFRRVSIMASDKTMGVRLGIDKGRLSVEADNPDLGNARERIEVTYKGEAIQCGYNARYFVEVLSEMNSPEVKIEMEGELDPLVVRPADGADYVGVIMPMRI